MYAQYDEQVSLETAFCNLLERWGIGINPADLKQWFTEAFIYDVNPHSISLYNSQVVVTSGSNSPVPPINDSIVMFNNHYCLVDHLEGNIVYIVDSRDGVIKSPLEYESVYGPITGWVAYTYGNATIYKAPKGPLPFPYAKKRRQLTEPTKAYSNPIYAKNRTGHVLIFKPGDYREYQEKNGMILIGDDENRYWINPTRESVKVEPIPGLPQVEVQKTWRDTSEVFAPQTYYVNKNVMVVDFESKHRSIQFQRGEPITLYGSFIKNDETFGRVLIDSDDPTRQYWWYGINEKDLEAPQSDELEYNTTIAERRVLNQLTPFDYLTLAHAHLTNLLNYKQYFKKEK